MRILNLFFLISISSVLFAQEQCSCCSEFHKQFDFWIGKWIVKDTNGNVVGKNSIEKIEDNCLITERWEGASGSTGRSMNYFDRSDSTWNQLWVDNQGNPLKLKGDFKENKMVLKSELIQGSKGLYYNQVSWQKNPDGSVTQHWEIYQTDDKVIQTLFKGIYFKE